MRFETQSREFHAWMVSLFMLVMFSSRAQQPDSVFPYKGGGDSLRISYLKEGKKMSTIYYRGGGTHYVIRNGKSGKRDELLSYYPSGKMETQEVYSGDQRKLLKWDTVGRLLCKSTVWPYLSTNFKEVRRDYTYDAGGHLIKFEFVKEEVACYGGGLIRSRTITYDTGGNVLSRTRVNGRAQRRRNNFF